MCPSKSRKLPFRQDLTLLPTLDIMPTSLNIVCKHHLQTAFYDPHLIITPRTGVVVTPSAED